MASDWMKVEKVTPGKPEVEGIAAALKMDPDAAFGKLFRVWSWFDDCTTDGNAPCVTTLLIDRKTRAPGFGQAMIDAGWLVENESGLTMPNFCRHNGEDARKRALTKERVAKCKAAKKAVKGKAGFNRPTMEEVKEHWEEKGYKRGSDRFFDYYEANGWKVGRNAMKNWKAAARNWSARQFDDNSASSSATFESTTEKRERKNRETLKRVEKKHCGQIDEDGEPTILTDEEKACLPF